MRDLNTIPLVLALDVTSERAFIDLGISLCLGLLVGLQREMTEAKVAGVRTFALITLFGSMCGLLSGDYGGWVLGAGFIGVTAAIVLGNVLTITKGRAGGGITTEIAALSMFGVGALLVVQDPEAASETVKNQRAVAVALGVAIAVLLHAKDPLHRLTDRMSEHDIRAIMIFALMTFIVLPVLPDAAYGPYSVLNPRQIWLMVVLVVGISLAGYIAYKALGDRAGAVAAGLLGGVMSSTATTVSYARRAASLNGAAWSAIVVILLATGVSYGRLLVEISVVAPAHFNDLAAELSLLLGAMLVLGFACVAIARREDGELPERENPTELKSALLFGVMYAGVLLLSASASDLFGDGGLFFVAGVSGLANLDAITISTARLVREGRLESAVGSDALLVAAMSNMGFKVLLAGMLARPSLALRLALAFLPCAVLAVLLILFL